MPGEEVYVVGDTLCQWKVESGVKLSTGPGLYPKWKSLQAARVSGRRLEYKYVIVSANNFGAPQWETGANRIID